MRKNVFTILSVFIGLLSSIQAQKTEAVFFTNGFKVGELTNSSAIVWTRLCAAEKAVPIRHQQKGAPFRSPIDFDNNMPVQEMDGAVPGAFGQVRIKVQSKDTLIQTQWEYVSAYQDYTIKRKIKGLRSNTKYQIIITGRKGPKTPVSEVKGEFTTAPLPNEIAPVLFTSSTCQYFWSYDDAERGFKMYDSMLKLEPMFHCQTGDYVYYDKPGPMAYNLELARHKWHAINAWPSLVNFYNNTPLYLQKDDHDVLKDDAMPTSSAFGELGFEDGLWIWNEQAPIMDKSYRTFRWGKDLQIWVVEGRDFRSDNSSPDGADKSIWGKEQLEWFKKTVEASDATFKILSSPTPVVGPDRAKGKTDNHSNDSFKTEGEWLRKYLADHGMFVINGDRHWQYVSVDPDTGLMEFSQGPSSDSHAQGWNKNDKRPEHRFLRVKGGFLAVNVFREGDTPIVEFIHYDVDGNIVNKETIKKQ
ncbi:alkaline phosphatase D family protein [Cellulophaga sp. F20128]|uniref:alkaline phosphatase D family protein n=1 Tax=Cellulophaga sp. F20128 TaxID=2926413 RepID=UPI001FF66E01|nr:alkaline phosphatase D family protein [Cellulophaga sp. F20128]MCK0158029.1 alkaline phosphatase D family protein [Cellulophaga sp. F20128]